MRGNILRLSVPDTQAPGYVEMYMGNGRFGATFDPYGFMNAARGPSGDRVVQLPDGGWIGAQPPPATVFMHTDHWIEGSYGLQGLAPVATLLLRNGPDVPSEYRQEHDVYNGTLTTTMGFSGVRWQTTAFFCPDERDVFAMKIDYSADDALRVPSIVLEVVTATLSFYGGAHAGRLRPLRFDPGARTWMGNLRIANADTAIGARVLCEEGVVDIRPHADGLSVTPVSASARFLLLIGVAAAAREEPMMASLDRVSEIGSWLGLCQRAWVRARGTAAIHVPDDRVQALFDRSVYFILSSVSPDVTSPCQACGLTTFGWGWAGFCPQDFSYVFPALLRLGFIEIARAKIEYFRRCIPAARRCTRRIYGADGVMWPWEHPVSTEFDILRGSSPNWFQFEIHNTAYPARMAFETAVHARDDAWALENAWPVVCESTRFFSSIARQEPDTHTWSLAVTPSMGQDEYGGVNGRNYLCALFSAQYCFESALALARRLGCGDRPELERWERILEDGLSYGRLTDEQGGILSTHERLDASDGMHRQKHPVQLNPIVFLPLSGGITPALRAAYAARYDLCIGVREGRPQGWTGLAFLLAASHMADADGLLRDLEQLEKTRNVDPGLIQIYEDAEHGIGKYYTTTQGLFLQAILDAMVCDYWGGTVVGAACPREWEEVSFTGLHVADGRVLSGSRSRGRWTVSESAT